MADQTVRFIIKRPPAPMRRHTGRNSICAGVGNERHYWIDGHR
jgi:hypothetical protein